jgi:hypothetical protein
MEQAAAAGDLRTAATLALALLKKTVPDAEAATLKPGDSFAALLTEATQYECPPASCATEGTG